MAAMCSWFRYAPVSSCPPSVRGALQQPAAEAADPHDGHFLLQLPMARSTGQFRHSQLWRICFGVLNSILSIWGLKLSSGVFQICKCNIIVTNEIKLHSIVKIFPLLDIQMKGRRKQLANAQCRCNSVNPDKMNTLTPFSSRWWTISQRRIGPYHLWQCSSSVFWMTRLLHSTESYTQTALHNP